MGPHVAAPQEPADAQAGVLEKRAAGMRLLQYKTRPKRAPVMGAWAGVLEAMLLEDAPRPRKEKRTARRLHDALVRAGFGGLYPTVQR